MVFPICITLVFFVYIFVEFFAIKRYYSKNEDELYYLETRIEKLEELLTQYLNNKEN